MLAASSSSAPRWPASARPRRCATRASTGSITVVGDEPHQPYDRPPLSKQVLAGHVGRRPRSRCAGGERDRRPRRRVAARRRRPSALDLADPRASPSTTDRRVAVRRPGHRHRRRRPRRCPGTAGIAGRAHAAHARRLPAPSAPTSTAAPTGSWSSAPASSAPRWRPPAAGAARRHVGRGAARARSSACSAPRWAPSVADLHRDHGVDLRLGVGVDGLERTATAASTACPPRRRQRRSTPTWSSSASASRPNTAWLEGSGLTLDDGVVCDATLLAAPGVVAAGDVARWPNARSRRGDARRALGQRDGDGRARGPTAAGRGDGAGREPYRARCPGSGRDQYDRKIQLAGRAGPTTTSPWSRIARGAPLRRPLRAPRSRRRACSGSTWPDGWLGTGRSSAVVWPGMTRWRMRPRTRLGREVVCAAGPRTMAPCDGSSTRAGRGRSWAAH